MRLNFSISPLPRPTVSALWEHRAATLSSRRDGGGRGGAEGGGWWVVGGGGWQGVNRRGRRDDERGIEREAGRHFTFHKPLWQGFVWLAVEPVQRFTLRN